MKSSKRLKSSDNDDDNMLQKSLSRTLENFRCPLSLRLMVRPIAPGDDQMYDKSSWNEYVNRQHNEHPNMVISPITRETIDMSNVYELPKPVLNTMKDTVIQAANTLSPGDSDMSDVEDWLIRYVKEEEDKVTFAMKRTQDDLNLVKKLQADMDAKWEEWRELTYKKTAQEAVLGESENKETKSKDNFDAFKKDVLRGLPLRFAGMLFDAGDESELEVESVSASED